MKNKIEKIINDLKNDIDKAREERKSALREIKKTQFVSKENVQIFNYTEGVINQSEAIIYQLNSII